MEIFQPMGQTAQLPIPQSISTIHQPPMFIAPNQQLQQPRINQNQYC